MKQNLKCLQRTYNNKELKQARVICITRQSMHSKGQGVNAIESSINFLIRICQYGDLIVPIESLWP